MIKITDYDAYLASVLDGVAGRAAPQPARVAAVGLEFARLLLHHVAVDSSSLSTSEFPETIGRIVRLATPPKAGAGAAQDALHRVHRLTKQQGRELVVLAQKLMAAQRKEALAAQARQAGGAGAAGQAGGPAQQVRPEVKEHAAHYLRSWYILCQKGMLPRVAPVPPEEAPEALTTFFGRMQQGGLLTSANRTWRQMMSALIELAVDQALQGLSPAAAEGAPPPDYSAIDSLASLIVNAVKYYPAGAGADNQARLGFFDWTMSIIADHMLADQRRRGPAWNQRPFFRLLLEIIQTVGDSDPCLDVDVQTNVVVAMASSSETLHVLRFQLVKVITRELHKLRPAEVPSFAFGWLQLISHRSYMPRLLIDTSGWPMLKALLVDLFIFLRPFLRNIKLNAAVRQLYNGTLRVLLVLLHDFPEFLCEFHFAFCDVIPVRAVCRSIFRRGVPFAGFSSLPRPRLTAPALPPALPPASFHRRRRRSTTPQETCIQLRNLVLSAFPRLNAQNQPFKLPDPFMLGLKVDQLPDIAHSPRVRSEYRAALSRIATPYAKAEPGDGAATMTLLEALSAYVASRQPPQLLAHIYRFLKLPPAQAHERGCECVRRSFFCLFYSFVCSQQTKE